MIGSVTESLFLEVSTLHTIAVQRLLIDVKKWVLKCQATSKKNWIVCHKILSVGLIDFADVIRPYDQLNNENDKVQSEPALEIFTC